MHPRLKCVPVLRLFINFICSGLFFVYYCDCTSTSTSAIVTRQSRGSLLCIRTDEGAGMALCLKLCLASCSRLETCLRQQKYIHTYSSGRAAMVSIESKTIQKRDHVAGGNNKSKADKSKAGFDPNFDNAIKVIQQSTGCAC